jgi:hypothetical protein
MLWSHGPTYKVLHRLHPVFTYLHLAKALSIQSKMIRLACKTRLDIQVPCISYACNSHKDGQVSCTPLQKPIYSARWSGVHATPQQQSIYSARCSSVYAIPSGGPGLLHVAIENFLQSKVVTFACNTHMEGQFSCILQQQSLYRPRWSVLYAVPTWSIRSLACRNSSHFTEQDGKFCMQPYLEDRSLAMQQWQSLYRARRSGLHATPTLRIRSLACRNSNHVTEKGDQFCMQPPPYAHQL